MASIEKTMPAIMVNGSYQVSVTSAEMSIIQENSSSSYEITLFLRNAAGDSDVSNVLSATPSNLPNTPTQKYAREGNIDALSEYTSTIK